MLINYSFDRFIQKIRLMHVPCYLNRVFADTCNYGDDRLQHFCPYFDL